MARSANHIKQEQWIAAYIENGGQKKKACVAVGVTEEGVRGWFKDINFRKRLSKATCQWREMLHAAGMRRALAGSDRLLEYFLTRFDLNFDPGIRKLKFEKRNGLGQFAKKEPSDAAPTGPVTINMYSGPVPPDAGPDHSEPEGGAA